jgi:hypothetical protein
MLTMTSLHPVRLVVPKTVNDTLSQFSLQLQQQNTKTPLSDQAQSAKLAFQSHFPKLKHVITKHAERNQAHGKLHEQLEAQERLFATEHGVLRRLFIFTRINALQREHDEMMVCMDVICREGHEMCDMPIIHWIYSVVSRCVFRSCKNLCIMS